MPMKKTWFMNKAVSSREDLSNVTVLKEAFELSELPLPEILPGQVLVKVACCTLNNNDLVHVAGTYEASQDVPIPRPLGFEGSGLVIQSKGPWYTPQAGARVAFYADHGGVLGHYVVCDAKKVIPIPSDVTYETAACSVSNPATAIVMVDRVRSAGHKVFVNTAPAGALGRLILKYARSVGVDVICIVRNEAQQEICKKDGATHILNSTDPEFDQKLAEVMKTTNCTYCYDCLSGDMPDRLLKAGPNKTVVSIYGKLQSEECKFQVAHLHAEKRIEFFLVSLELEQMWLHQQLIVILKLRKWMSQPDMKTIVRKSYPFEKVPEAFADYASTSQTAGKIQVIVHASMEPHPEVEAI